MSSEDQLRSSVALVEANSDFTEAVVRFADDSRLYFCHRVGERWAKAVPAVGRQENEGFAAFLLASVSMFRLNAKHLEMAFADGSRWEHAFAPLSQ